MQRARVTMVGSCLNSTTPLRKGFEFTTRLAKVGFDANYDPTREGAMLEELIDRFSR